jgi:hypothetical protein
MNYKIFNLNQTRSIAIISQPKQPSESSHNISPHVGFLITLAFIGCVLGCVFILRKSQKQHQELDERIQKIQILEKMQAESPSIDKKLSLQTKKQIETLEKIWNKSP